MDPYSTRGPSSKSLLSHYAQFLLPRRLTILWTCGAILCVFIFLLFCSGLFLALNYTPDADLAFASLEDLERHIPYGWVTRSIHLTAASFLFFFLYAHIARSLYYRCYQTPHHKLWFGGCILYALCCLMAISGYILPFNQMSYWASAIMGNILRALPLIGPYFQAIFLGGPQPGTATLHRMFVLHFAIAFVLISAIVVHIRMRHRTMYTKRTVPPDQKNDYLPFYPYYFIKDSLAILVALLVFTFIMCFFPDLGHERSFYRPANPLHTPAAISPPWYLLIPFSIMQAIPSKIGGLLCAGGSFAILFAVPWLDRTRPSKHPSCKQQFIHHTLCLTMFASAFLIAYGGYRHLTGFWAPLVQVSIPVYYSYFLLYLPFSPFILREQ